MKHRMTAILLVFLILLLPVSGMAKAGFKSYFEGDPESCKIAITMDDLYGLTNVEKTLDLCREYQIHMTFFALGCVIKEENAALWQRILDEGHEIGNHTYRHKNINDLTAYQLERELIRTQETLNAVLEEPYTMRLFRPPYGKYDRTGRGSTEVLGKLGYPYVIMWTVDSTNPKEAFTLTKNGSILIFHANNTDVRCLETLIPLLLDMGFEPVTVSELLDMPPMEQENDDTE
jgi:peptidoglycan-N-acetylglucosamine deacetylase